jgi:hypothetical protein
MKRRRRVKVEREVLKRGRNRREVKPLPSSYGKGWRGVFC